MRTLNPSPGASIRCDGPFDAFGSISGEMISTATARPAHLGRRRRKAVFSFGGIKRPGSQRPQRFPGKTNDRPFLISQSGS